MKEKILLGLIAAISAILLMAVAFAKPTAFTVNYNQAQFQWRGVSASGDWTPGYSYQNAAETSDYTLTGNTLHTEWSYSPLVTDLTGQSTVYTYDKDSELWIEKEGQVSYKYVPGYGDYTVVNYFRGYLNFGGDTPSATSFVHGVAYQWVYLFAPQDAILTGLYTGNAVWDDKVGAWRVGFSIYLWDTDTQSYTTSFPDPFIEPVPANNYNPLGI